MLYGIAETRELIADALADDFLRKRTDFLEPKWFCAGGRQGIRAEEPLEIRKFLKEAGAGVTEGR